MYMFIKLLAESFFSIMFFYFMIGFFFELKWFIY